jgi:hypothetical protein
MFHRTFLALILVAMFKVLCAQAPAIEWQRSFGGSFSDQGKAIALTVDGGMIMAGSSASVDGDLTTNNGSYDCWVIKLDSNGDIQWQRTLGGNSLDYLFAISPCIDGGFYVAGWTSSISGEIVSSNGDADCLVVKLSATGSIEWTRTLGGSEGDSAMSIAATADGGAIMVGSSESANGDVTENQGSYDWWVVKLDATGSIQWQRSFGGSGYWDSAESVALTSDGGYLIAGSTNSPDGDVVDHFGERDYWVIKLDASGTLQWQKTLGGSDGDLPRALSTTVDGGSIVVGNTLSTDGDITSNYGSADFWVVKLDAYGTLQWQRTYGGSGSETAYSVASTFDGGFIVVGESTSDDGDVTDPRGGLDFWILKIDATGTLQWQRSLGGSGDDRCLAVAPSSDGDYFVVGHSKSIDGDITDPNGMEDCWIVKLNHEFNSINGIAYADLNSDGLPDTDEPRLANHRLHLVDGTMPTWSNANGEYELNVFTPGTFEVQPTPVPHFLATPVTHSATFTGFLETDPLNDFAFQPVGVINDLSVSIAPLTAFRPGFTGRYLIHYQNIGNTVIAPTVGFQFVHPFTYLSATLEPTAITADSVSWQLPELQPFEEGTIEVNVNISTTAVLGSTIIAAATIFPLEGDANIADNKAQWWVTITGSYDPNDIQVDRPEISPEELADGVDLTYLIRFQNTGTDTAFTVRVDNPVPVNADFDTFDFIAASHTVQISYAAATSKFSFLFNNILLPDSNTNEPESHGYILYRMKPRSTLVLGDSVLNQVGIYFDYNLPIITNVAHTVIEQSVGMAQASASSSFTLFPNPTTGEVMIQVPRPVSNGSITVTDAMGRTVLQVLMNGNTHHLDMGALPRGFYVVAVQDAEGVSQQQVVLE